MICVKLGSPKMISTPIKSIPRNFDDVRIVSGEQIYINMEKIFKPEYNLRKNQISMPSSSFARDSNSALFVEQLSCMLYAQRIIFCQKQLTSF